MYSQNYPKNKKIAKKIVSRIEDFAEILYIETSKEIYLFELFQDIYFTLTELYPVSKRFFVIASEHENIEKSYIKLDYP